MRIYNSKQLIGVYQADDRNMYRSAWVMKVTMFKPVSKPAFHPARNKIFIIFINLLWIGIAQLEKPKDQLAALQQYQRKKKW